MNLERPLHKDSRFGGHFVQGHIDTICTLISSVPDSGSSKLYTFQIPATNTESDPIKYIVPKGNITLDGASLTIVSVDSATRTFSILLTPYTASHVTLSTKPAGSKINVEVDVVGKYVENVVRKLGEVGKQPSSSTSAISGEISGSAVQETVQEVISAFVTGENIGTDIAVRRVLENVVEGTVRNLLGEKVVDGSPRFTLEEAKKSYEEGIKKGEEEDGFEFDDMDEALAEFGERGAEPMRRLFLCKNVADLALPFSPSLHCVRHARA